VPFYSIVLPVLSRIRVHYLESASHDFFLSLSLQKDTHLFRSDTPKTTYINYLICSQNNNIYGSAYGVPTLLLPCTGDPYLLLANADVIFLFVSDIQHSYIPHTTFSPKRQPQPSGIIIIFFLHTYIINLLLLWGCTLNATYFFLTDNAFAIDKHKRLDLSKRFEEATSSTKVFIGSLEINKMYPIVRAERINTKFGSTVLLSIRDSEAQIVQIFLPKRYRDVVSDYNMDRIYSKSFPKSYL